MRHRQAAIISLAVVLAACTRVPTTASPRDDDRRGDSPANPPAAVQSAVNLFTAAPAIPSIDTARETGVIRNRYVGVNLSLLDEAEHNRSFTLNLFEDASFTAVVETAETRGAGSATVSGRLAGVESSSWTLVASEGVVIGSIVTPEGQYQVRYAGNGVHAVRQFDASQLPKEGPPVNPARRPPDGH